MINWKNESRNYMFLTWFRHFKVKCWVILDFMASCTKCSICIFYLEEAKCSKPVICSLALILRKDNIYQSWKQNKQRMKQMIETQRVFIIIQMVKQLL